MINYSIKWILFLFVTILIFFVSIFLLSHYRFIQNDFDKNFDKKLYSAISEKIPVKVSDINTEDWDEVCIIYIDQKPEYGEIGKKYSRQLKDYFYLSDGMDYFPFLSKFKQPVWWMFFVDNKGEIVDLYRLGGSTVPAFYLGDDTDRDYYNHYQSMLSNFGLVMTYPDQCNKRNSAFFVQTETLYNSVKAFIFASKI